MAEVGGWTYFIWFVGFSILGIVLFVIVHLVKKRKRGDTMYIADRYKHCGSNHVIDYRPSKQEKESTK